ncbi:MAG: ATP-binding protein [Blastocatellales bacterium]
MNLRNKLLLSFLIFIVALVALGGGSAWRLRELGGASQRIIAHNYDSVVAAQDMKESLERMDSAAFFLLLGDRDRALARFNQHRARFDTAFEKAASNITEPGEAQIVESIRSGRDEYYRRFNALIVAGERRSGDYFQQLEPLFNKLRADCDQLFHLNQRAMQAKSEAAANVARREFLLTLLLAGVLVAAGLALAVLLANGIVRPLRELTATAAKIAGGALAAKAQITPCDETGILAAEFNRMAERIQQLRRSDLGRIIVAQQTTEAAIDAIFEPVIVTDGEGKVTRLNHAAEALFGSRARIVGKAISEVVHDQRVAMAVSESLRAERPVTSERAAAAIPISINGSEQCFRLRTTPMRNEDGHLLGAVVLLENITHLREVDRLKSEFVNTAAHYLQTNLEMGLHCLIADAAGELTDKQKDILYACCEDSERLERLMRDLTDLSRIESGEAAPHFAPVNIEEVIQSAIESYRLTADAKDQSLKTDIAAGLPRLNADAEQIKRVFDNLLSNSIRHTPRGGEIQVTSARREDYISISVTDTGHGIPPEYLPRLFNRFLSVPGSQSGGAGLGLAISKRLIEAHGGQISAQSEIGRGTAISCCQSPMKAPVIAKLRKPTEPGAARRFQLTKAKGDAPS